jgi:uncharacterized protein (DUF2147 family)
LSTFRTASLFLNDGPINFKEEMMKKLLITTVASLTLAAGFAMPTLAVAQAKDTPVGLWKTIDDETKQARSLVRITEKDGVLTGKIEKILDPAKADSKCTACTDARKDQPVQGMTILTGLKKFEAEWGEGQILDPNNGKTYKAKAKVLEGGKKLEVRGFVGIAALGRSQTWVREEEK